MSASTTTTTVSSVAASAAGVLRRGLAPASATPVTFPPVQSVVRNQTKVFLHFRDLYHAAASPDTGTAGSSILGGNVEGAALMNSDVEMERLSGSDRESLADSVAISVPPVWEGVQNDIQGFMDAVRQKIAKLQELQAAQFLVEIEDSPVQEQQRVEVATAEVSRLLGEVQKRVQQMGVLAKRATGEEAAIIHNLQTAYAQQLTELTQTFRSAQRNYLTSIRKRDAKFRDSFTVTSGNPDDDDSILDYEDKGFTDDQMAHMQATERDVSIRDKQIRKIYRSIVELNEMTKDLAMLIVDQGTILDRIDYNIENASYETERAVEELTQAEKHQKKARTKLCVIILLVGVIVAAIILGLRVFHLF